VQRIEHLLAPPKTAGVGGDLLPIRNHGDAVHIPLHRDRPEREAPRHAVAVGVEAHRLVPIYLGGLDHAGVEPVRWRRQGDPLIRREALADGHVVVDTRTLAGHLAAVPQVIVQLVQVPDLRHGRGPLPLEILHSLLHPRLLRGLGRQAELGSEGVLRREGRVARVQGAIPPAEQVDGDRSRVIPPQFLRHAAEEGKRLDQAMLDGPVRSVGRAMANGQFE
jgi:hypothetical protein